MQIFTEELVDDLDMVVDNATRVHLAAQHMATLGLRLFPARPFNQEKLESSLAEFIKDRDDAKAEKRKAVYGQRHFQQHTGKMPVFDRDQYTRATAEAATIDKWWNPVDGKYRGHNICLATGEQSGVIVVDLDVKIDEKGNKEDGFLWWNEITAHRPEIKTFRVRTGGKTGAGMHIYFKWRPDAASNRNGLADGVDFRTNNGHVMAPFSRCYNEYEVIDDSPVADMPDWLFEEMFGARDKSKPARDFDDQKSEGSSFGATPLDQIEEMLSFIDPIEHEEWWSDICFAIKSEHDTDEGFEVLDQWSALDPSEHDRNRNLDYWQRGKSKKQGGVQISTLYYYAEQCGWVNPKKGVTYLDVSRAVRIMNRTFAIIDPDRYMVGLARMGRSFDHSRLPPGYVPSMTMFKTKHVLTDAATPMVHAYGKVAEVMPGQIDMMTSGFKVMQELPGNKVKVSSMRDVWMASAARKSYASIGYYVNEQRTPAGVLNLFPGFAVSPKNGHPTKFVEHITKIICSGDEEKASWIFNRLAYMVQYGDQVMPTSLVITGAQGAGKSIIGDYLKAMLGTLNYKYLHDAEALKTRFSEELVGKFMIVADEAIFSGDPVLRNKLKSMIAAEVLREEGKGKAAKDAQNVMFLLVFSNEDEPVGIEPGDRRFTVLKPDDMYSFKRTQESAEVRKMASKYFSELVKEMEGDGPANLLHMLMNWDVDKMQARTPLATQEKQNMAETRLLKCDSLLAYFYFLYTMGYTDENDKDEPNPNGEHWGGRIRTGTFYENYCTWSREQKSHHRNSEWKAEPTNRFTARICEEFACGIVKPSGRSTVILPDEALIKNILMQKLPEVMKIEILSEKETDF